MTLALALAATIRSPSPSSAESQLDVQYYGGPVMHTSTVYLIFWLPQGFHFRPDGNDSRYEQLIEQYFRDVGGSSYYNILTQYSYAPGGQLVRNGPILNSSTVGGVYVDTTPFHLGGPTGSALWIGDIRNELPRVIDANHWQEGLDKEFFVFTPAGVDLCGRSDGKCTTTQDGTRWECARHDYEMRPGSAPGSMPLDGHPPIIYALIADLQSIRCQTGRRPDRANPYDDPYVDWAIFTASEEHFEAVTDPIDDVGGNAWLTTPQTETEITDICDRIGNARDPDGADITLNGHRYYVARQWSNRDHNCVLSSDYVPPTPTEAQLLAANPTLAATAAPSPTASPTAAPAATPTPTPTATPIPATDPLRAVLTWASRAGTNLRIPGCARRYGLIHGKCRKTHGYSNSR